MLIIKKLLNYIAFPEKGGSLESEGHFHQVSCDRTNLVPLRVLANWIAFVPKALGQSRSHAVCFSRRSEILIGPHFSSPHAQAVSIILGLSTKRFQRDPRPALSTIRPFDPQQQDPRSRTKMPAQAQVGTTTSPAKAATLSRLATVQTRISGTRYPLLSEKWLTLLGF